MLKKYFELAEKESKNSDDFKLKITKRDNDWKFEIKLTKNKFEYVRLKLYLKSLEKLTSTGVKESRIKDPLWKLLL